MAWSGRYSYLMARREVRNVELYAMDLTWKLVQMKTRSDLPMPSEVWHNKNKIDRRSGKQILDDLEKHVGGE